MSKNLSYVGNSLPKPNYSPLKFKSSLSQSMIENNHISRSQKIVKHSSGEKIEKLDHSVKIQLNLPPLSGPSLIKHSKMHRYEEF